MRNRTNVVYHNLYAIYNRISYMLTQTDTPYKGIQITVTPVEKARIEDALALIEAQDEQIRKLKNDISELKEGK